MDATITITTASSTVQTARAECSHCDYVRSYRSTDTRPGFFMTDRRKRLKWAPAARAHFGLQLHLERTHHISAHAQMIDTQAAQQKGGAA